MTGLTGGRLLGDMPGLYAPLDSAFRGNLRAIRAQARMQALTNPYAKQAKRSLQVNLIGPRGVQMRGTIPLGGRSDQAAGRALADSTRHVAALLSERRMGEELDEALDRMIRAQAALERDEDLNRILESRWRQFCRADNFDLAGRFSFQQFELMIVGALPTHGGALVRIVRQAAGRRKKGPQICFELLSVDQLDDDFNGPSKRSGHYWRMGVETNDWTGRVTRYAILRRPPGSVDADDPMTAGPRHWFVDARDMIHIFFPEEIGQNREFPWLAGVLPTIHNVNEYEKSHWTRKRVVNNLLGFIQKAETEFPSADSSLVTEREPTTGEAISQSSPGQWVELLPGEVPIQPQFGPDDQQFDVVLKTMLRRFASGVGLSYSTISRDYSDANYSSMRESLLEDRDHFRTIQSSLIQQFHQRVYEEWLDAAMLSGDLPGDAFANFWVEPELYSAPRWQARTWSWVDPAKELVAVEKSLALGLQSASDVIGEMFGQDVESVWAQAAYERELRRRLGLPIPGATAAPGEAPAAAAEGDPASAGD